MLGIGFVHMQRERFTADLFERVQAWYADGHICNWAEVDVSATLILQPLVLDGHIEHARFAPWRKSESVWQRRASAVTSIGMIGGQAINAGGIKKGKPVVDRAVPVLELLEFMRPILNDPHKKVQQGLGWFLRTAWQRFPDETEPWLIENRDQIASLSMRTATEKMDKATKEKVKGPARRRTRK